MAGVAKVGQWVKAYIKKTLAPTNEPKWLALHILITAMHGFPVGWILFRSLPAAIFTTIISGFWAGGHRGPVDRKGNKAIRHEFKELLQALAGLVGVGIPLEKAFVQLQERQGPSRDKIKRLDKGVSQVVASLRLGQSMSQAITSLACVEERSVQDFIAIVRISTRMGGRLEDQLYKIIRQLEEGMAVEEERWLLTAEKRMEQKMLFWISIGMLESLYGTMPDVMVVLHETPLGQFVLLLFVLVLYGAKGLATKVLEGK